LKLSSRVDYALSCILRLLDIYDGRNPVTITEVAEKEKIGPDYVEQLFVKMRKKGILKSARGKKGGYIAAVRPSEISVKDIVLSIDKEVLELVCFRKKGRRKKCVHMKDCRIRPLWKGLRRDMEKFLDGWTLDRLLELRRKEKNW